MSKGKVLLGVMAGAAFGAVLGILFAPDKGSSTRKKILNKRDDLLDETEEKFNDFINGMTNKFGKVSEEAADMIKKGKKRVEEAEAEILSS